MTCYRSFEKWVSASSPPISTDWFAMSQPLKLRGLFPAPTVPFERTGAIDHNEFGAYLASMSRIEGVSGVAVNGHAGELISLTPAERLNVVRTARSVFSTEQYVIAGVDPVSGEAGIDVLLETRAAGADAVLVLPPFDSMARRTLSRSPVAPVRFFEKLAEADVPIVVFQYPHATGCDYTTETLAEIARIDQVVAVKNAVWHAEYYLEQLTAVRGQAAVLAACDAPELLSMMMLGADGLLLGASAVGTEHWAMYVTHLRDGNYSAARDVFATTLLPILDATFGSTRPRSATFAALTKYALQVLGVFSSARVRAPEIQPDEKDKGIVRTAMAAAGLI